jgi:hypothetical protein
MSDPAETTDGLLALQAKRAAGKRPSNPARRMPPSQNPSTLPPYKTPEVVVDSREGTESEATTGTGDAPPPASKPTEPGAQVRVTVYVEETHDAYLENVRFVGAHRRPRIDVSRAAVVRYALDRLMADMTPEQVYQTIAGKPVDPRTTGRKRR